MTIIETPLDGVKLIELDRFEDDRGWFAELWNDERYRDAGLDVRFVQTNVSCSAYGVLRGMHYQTPHEQGKLVNVLAGSVFDVVVDVRRGSRSFGHWYGCQLSAHNRRQLWVPEGFAHGFLVTQGDAVVHYNCTSHYAAVADRSVAWNDAAVGIVWPFEPLMVSSKDVGAPTLERIRPEDLPVLESVGK